MYAFQNGFYHEKGHILFLKLGISALGHHIPRLVTKFNLQVLLHEMIFSCMLMKVCHNFNFPLLYIYNIDHPYYKVSLQLIAGTAPVFSM